MESEKVTIYRDWGPDSISVNNGPFAHIPAQDAQSVAEAVHLAIKLLEDGIRSVEGEPFHDQGALWARRSPAILDELKPAMMILAPYMPHPIGDSTLENPATTPEPSREVTGSTEDVRGYLDGTDEQSYSTRHG